ncbi:MAG: type II secretion system protein [bacterium]
MQYAKQRDAETRRRGDTVTEVRIAGRRVTLSFVPLSPEPQITARASAGRRGFTLIELVMTITIMTILTLGIIPLVKVSVNRQKEQQLRDSLRQMRIAIDEFHRDTVGMPQAGPGGVIQQQQQQQPQQQLPPDPRSRVVISDLTIFGVDNPDRYPPDLESLVNGVNVIPRAGGGLAGRGNPDVNATDVGSAKLATKKKVYLRAIPIDPMTGKAEWELRSCYDAADAGSWGGENVFDVRSKSKEIALNGEKYSDW